MTGNEIRETFLRYFEQHGHTRVRSSPLLPANDPTLLFTNAGMNQFKDVFLGLEKRDYVRACSSQKCIRAGGKHNDLDEVGKTARHQTFFEMLGNFSFGDYFKREAIEFAWDLLVNVYGLDPNYLWFSVFEGDEEVPADEDAAALWEAVGAPKERILRFGRKDNFWQMGDTGPCGPCSEIHYYMGEDPRDPAKNRAEFVNGPGDTTIEIWNLVFMQFNRIGEGEQDPTTGKYSSYRLEPLPKPSVDTGMGLERLAAVLQGKKNNYDTDLLKDFVQFTAKLADRAYEPDTQEGFAMRVIADHARATAFSIADGILPGNKERNSVLRKIMRRAIYWGRHLLDFQEPFLHEVANHVVDLMQDVYPELESRRDLISKLVNKEEQSFIHTLTTGLKKREDILTELFGTAFKQNFPELLDKEEDPSVGVYSLGNQSMEVEGEKRSYLLDKKSGKAIKVQITKPDGSVIYEPIESVTERWEKQRIEEMEYMYRLSRPAREAYELYRPWIEESERVRQYIDQTGMFRRLARLYDTYGVPPDLIRLGLEERGWQVNEETFDEQFNEAIKSLQESQRVSTSEKVSIKKAKPIYTKVSERASQSEFKGYETTTVENSQIIALIKGDDEVESLSEGDEGEAVLNHTPFYAESGGQVGDVGVFIGDGARAVVQDTYAPAQGLIVHKVKVEKGSLKVGDVVSAQVDVERRDATRRNHTATHLMHAALREVLGTHVKQAGSVVAPNFLRFDFTHFQPLSDDEIKEVERLVNYHILRNEQVQTDELALEEAMQSGAMALFGEKYAEKVRVLSVPGAEGVFSKELCGGTHVRSTGDIGLFKIVSDESIASGTRRIRAVTGWDALARFRESEAVVDQLAGTLRATRGDLPATVERLQDELKRARREAEQLKQRIASGAGTAAAGNGSEAQEVAGVQVLAREASELDAAGLRQLSDTLLARVKSGVVVLGRRDEGKVSLIVRTSKDLQGRVPAGQVIRELAPLVGGRGGGKPDMAEGGGSQPDKLAEALAASYQIVEKLLAQAAG